MRVLLRHHANEAPQHAKRRTRPMKIFASALAAASLSFLAVAPAAAEEVQATVYYGDLDISSAAGAETLNARLLGTIKSVCERPAVLDIKANVAWNECKDAAMSSALEQLAESGASLPRATVTVGN